MKNWINEHRAFVNYFFISCFVTIIDVVVSRVCEAFTVSVAANTIGVVVGFVIQYFLCTKKVYEGSSMWTLLIFFATWLVGLALADLIIYVVRVLIFGNADGILYFLVGKFFSIAIPFFVTYFIRKKLILENSDKGYSNKD